MELKTNGESDGHQIVEAILQSQSSIVEAIHGLTQKVSDLQKDVRKVAHGSQHCQPHSHEDAIDVFIELVIRRVCDVNTITQTFGAMVVVVMRWKCPDDEELPVGNLEDDGGWVPRWRPVYTIKSLMADSEPHEHFSTYRKKGVVWITMEARHRVCIYEQLELNCFPRDCQDLTVELESRISRNRVRWLPLKAADGSSPIKLVANRCYLNDFVLLSDMPFTWMFYTSKDTHNKEFPCLKVCMKVVRNSLHYTSNVVLTTCILCSLVLCSWAVHPCELECRFTIDLTLILTAVAFKSVISTMIPKVSYTTPLDFYVLAGFMFLTSVTTCHAILPQVYVTTQEMSPLTLPPISLEHEQDVIEADELAFYVSGAVWFAFNVLYGIHFKWRQYFDAQSFKQQAMELQQKSDSSHDDVVNVYEGDDIIGRSPSALSVTQDPTRFASCSSNDPDSQGMMPFRDRLPSPEEPITPCKDQLAKTSPDQSTQSTERQCLKTPDGNMVVL